MTLPISPRLLACADFVAPGARIADVGCDHGYLGIYLLQNGVARHIFASDLREGPLKSAQSNAALYGVADRMEFFLSDGLQNVPHDFDTLVCAGMGGETMISILSAAPWLQSSQYRLILQCQTKTHLLRRYLSETGYRILRERVQRDRKFLYTVMEVCWEPESSRLTPGQWYFPPALLSNSTPETAQHYRWVLQELTKIVTSRGLDADPLMTKAMYELQDAQNHYSFLKEDGQ